MPVLIGDIDHAGRGDRDAGRLVEGGRGDCAIGAAQGAGACDGGHHAKLINLADAVVHLVGNIDVVAGIDGQLGRGIELGRRAGAVGVACRAQGARESGHHAQRRDLADAMVAGVRHEQVALAVAHHAERAGKGRRGACGVGAASGAGGRTGQNAPVVLRGGHHRHLEGVGVLQGAIVDGDGNIRHTGDVRLVLHREGAGVARTADCRGHVGWQNQVRVVAGRHNPRS